MPVDPDAPDVSIELVTLLAEPIDAVTAPNGEWWIAERRGRILVVDPDTGDVGDVIVDLSSQTIAEGEQGLLGIAVDDEALYVNLTDLAGTTHVDAFLLNERGRPGRRVELLAIPQPFEYHNGGSLVFDHEGRLLVGVGDGGSDGDELGHAQDPFSLLGSILRIDPTPTESVPYAIPEGNPFAGGGGAPEVFATGLRNPWRISIDSVTGDLWIGDVGEDDWEEVTVIAANQPGPSNLGWPLREGLERFGGDVPEHHVDPVFVYGGREIETAVGGCSVTGGEVYHGGDIPDLEGAYVFGDFCTAELWTLRRTDSGTRFVSLGVELPEAWLIDVSTDPRGELVMLSLDGSVHRLVAG